MSQEEPNEPYIYQPFGCQHTDNWKAGRIYAIGGLPILATIEGLTRKEANAILAALKTEGK